MMKLSFFVLLLSSFIISVVRTGRFSRDEIVSWFNHRDADGTHAPEFHTLLSALDSSKVEEANAVKNYEAKLSELKAIEERLKDVTAVKKEADQRLVDDPTSVTAKKHASVADTRFNLELQNLLRLRNELDLLRAPKIQKSVAVLIAIKDLIKYDPGVDDSDRKAANVLAIKAELQEAQYLNEAAQKELQKLFDKTAEKLDAYNTASDALSSLPADAAVAAKSNARQQVTNAQVAYATQVSDNLEYLTQAKTISTNLSQLRINLNLAIHGTK